MTYNAVNRTWTDTLGRTITDPMPSNWDEFAQNQVVEDKVAQFPSKDGGTYNVTFSWRYLKDPQGGESGLENTSENLHYLSDKYCQGNREHPVPGAYLFNSPEISLTRVCAPGYSQAAPPPNPIVLTKITLPNGQKYEFKYNVYGEISKIIYPTGAAERFQYAWIPPVQGIEASYEQANRGVISRWVSAKGDGTDEVAWTYSATLQYQQPFTVTTTAPDGTKTQQYLYWEGSDEPKPYGFGNAKTGRSYEDRVLSPTNQLLRRNLTKYITTGAQTGGYGGATRDMRPEKQVSIIFEPNESYALAQLSETVYDTNSDPAYFAELNAKQSKVYRYKVLSLSTAQTANIDTIAAMFSSADLETVMEIDYLYDTNYKARNINGLVSETRIKDAAENIKAKSQIFYDEAGYGIIDYGATTNWENPNTNYRGNPTTTRSWYDITNNQYIETHAQYDNFGNQRKVWDGRGNLSETEYTATYLYAYPTKVKTPKPDTNGTQGADTELISEVTYDFNTGLVLTAKDANNQISTMEYNDSLLRPTKAIAPNGHQTISEYGAGTSESTRWIKVRTQIDETNWKEGYSWFDGLGRTIKAQSVDSNGDVFSETEYDNMSRPKKATNPYRTGETKLWTESFYDDLGRVTKIKTPDNAEVLTAYSLATSGNQIGTAVTVTDQAGKLRRSVTNGLGQLLRVDEPNDSNQLGVIDNPNQPTSYGYDVLNNLITVNQGVQTRSFVYDSLSRLKSATNPESGAINYAYDANGNLTSKTDARSITTSYTYDALNRVRLRDYSDSTADVTYYYDNLTNAKGKLIKVSSDVSTTEYLSFDTMGRLLSHKQTTDGNAYPTGYTYNLSGALIEETYPSGRVVKNTLDADGSLQQVQSKKANDTFRNYANSFNYTATGAISSMRLGNGRWETMQFNSRLQPTQIGLGTSATNQSLLKLDYEYGALNLGTGQTIEGTNNGNVSKQTITVQNTANATGFSATQNYAYDSLNRIQIANENLTPNGGTLVNTWKQTFQYDRYGNRNFDEANTTTLPKNCGGTVCASDRKTLNPSISATNNRIIQDQDGDQVNDYLFDSAGNTTKDTSGSIFNYDAENKQIKVINSISQIVGEYFYDGDGKRIKKVVPATGETTVFVYDASGKMVAEYSTIIETPATAKVSYLTNDHLGSPRIITNEIGQVKSRRDFQPFGEEIYSAQRVQNLGYTTDNIRQNFTSYERDDETDLNFAQARYFNSGVGRFSSPDDFRNDTDTGSPQSWNLYIYVRNNPLKYIDPTGEEIWILYNEIDSTTGKSSISRVQYKNGKLYGTDGKEYKGSNDYVTKVFNDIETLRKSDDRLSSRIDTLANSKKTHTIEMTANPNDDNGNTPDSGTDDRNGVPTGTKTNYNPDKDTDVRGNKRPPVIGLAHELLGHGYDSDQGKSDYSKTLGDSIPYYEISAVNIENVARNSLGVAKRTSYGGKEIPKSSLWDTHPKPKLPSSTIYHPPDL